MTLEWKVPQVWNAFERNRARAYAVAFNLMVTLEMWTRAQALLKKGETRVATPFEVPKTGRHIGVGFWGAGRGFLSHHCVIEDGVLANYQIVTPSTVNACPQTPWGTPGPYEQAVLNTPLIESSFKHADDFRGIDILRALRSFHARGHDLCVRSLSRLRAVQREQFGAGGSGGRVAGRGGFPARAPARTAFARRPLGRPYRSG